ncbi:hypothetical protein NQ315_004306 [Exocentrus adspersus]|uniref:Secreted protein n=1 Tax=Exocentrus adspersus TaxID=1586481 RepID=A0AAV8W7G2_9CUCU|nr:hypothetical protein NQ315_004306 [Exocentrus adspersus]
MIPSITISVILATTFFTISQATITPQSSLYDTRVNSLPNYIYSYAQSQDSTNCCIIPTCDDFGHHCYETVSCGYVCSQGRYRPANKYGATPGYRLKEHYMKQDCHFGECKMYRFMCEHCPNPQERDFSIYTVRNDCKNCYH